MDESRLPGAIAQVVQSSSQPEQKSDVLDRLGEAPARTIYPRQRVEEVKKTDTTSETFRLETTTVTREERCFRIEVL